MATQKVVVGEQWGVVSQTGFFPEGVEQHSRGRRFGAPWVRIGNTVDAPTVLGDIPMLPRIFIALFAFAPAAFAAEKAPALPKGVEKVEATVEPAEAKPGQVVTFRLTVTLAGGYHTYPLVQTDKQAESMVNKIEFPAAGALIFVGEALDQPLAETKSEPLLGIKSMLYYKGKVTYERKAVVSPKASAGAATVAIPKFVLSICDKDSCFPPKSLAPEASVKVLDGPAVAVDPKYAAEVEKALKDR
jgi:hypothetical protein